MKKHGNKGAYEKLFKKTEHTKAVRSVHVRRKTGGDYDIVLPFGGLVPEKAIARFFAKVYKMRGSCWFWTGGLDKDKYGQFWFNGHNWRAHKFAHLLFNGPLREAGLEIDHICAHRKCVNPDHLVLMTKPENLYYRGGTRNKDGTIKLYQEKFDTPEEATGPVTIGPVGSVTEI